MHFTSQMLKIITEQSDTYPEDIPAAVSTAVRKIRSLPNFEDFVIEMVEYAIKERVFDARHRKNVAIRNQAGLYGLPAKVVVGKSKLANQNLLSYHNMRIAGTTLGSLYGHQLGKIAKHEWSRANGHVFNSRLCLRLKEIVKPHETVRQAVSGKKMALIFEEIRESVEAIGV